METNDWPRFTAGCTPYTFLGVTYLSNWLERDEKPYLDYLAQRRRLRLVCRAWNEFVLFTSHRWLLLGDYSPMYTLDSTTIRAKGGVGPIEILSTEISRNELVTPILTWASHILKRPASQSPLRSYILHFTSVTTLGYNPLDLLVGRTTTQDPECTNTNTTLRLLSITAIESNISISFSQISRTFTGLRSLFLRGLTAVPQQPLILAHLEVLYAEVVWEKWEDLQQSFETWHTPALRHVCLSSFSTQLSDLIDCFLGRYAHQIESLVLSGVNGYCSPCLDLPSGFWAQFTALRLLGLSDRTLKNKKWSGWSVVPPPTHPCQYLLCHFYSPVESELDRLAEWVVNDIRAGWTWDGGVRLVVGHVCADQFYVVKNIRGDPSIANMERNVRVLPEL